ncbi:MAG: hypothetical protein H6721_06710 [Sandaracinus sp.]|nr:hypothetical protein [Sandaracinus sp.]
MRRLMPWVVMAWLTWATWPSPSSLQLSTSAVRERSLRADLVAEVEILDVAAEADLDFAPQPLTVRVHRVFTAPRGTSRRHDADGALRPLLVAAVIRVPSSRIGQRSIMLFTLRDRVPVTAYCTPSLSPDEALPAVLEEARRRWLASR